MTGPKTSIRHGAQFTQGYLNQLGRIAEDAAKTDAAGKWGVDGWIRLIHNLIDLQIRTTTTVTQIALAGPGAWLRPIDREPWESDPITVKDFPFPQYFSIVKPFERLGRSDIRIPDTAIRFIPAILPPGETTFRIDLTDNNFVGANYVGEIALYRADSGPGARQLVQQLHVTVGL
ncbi:MAG: hypothetical protein ABWY93_06005 [Mycobacterium sp.]